MKLCECGCGEPAPIATMTSKRRGHVAGEPVRFRMGHAAKTKPPLVDRLIERIDFTRGECWVWTGSMLNTGYGRIMFKRRVDTAHRVVYEALVGPIPDGLHIDHLCRNRGCVNPAHLEPVTCAENIRRGPNVKLSKADAQAIRSLRGSRAKDVAAQFGVSETTVYLIWKGKQWAAA